MGDWETNILIFNTPLDIEQGNGMSSNSLLDNIKDVPSKIIDLTKKIFSFVTAYLTNEIYIEMFNDEQMTYSLTGKRLGPRDQKI